MKECGHPLCSVAPADWFNSHGSAHGHYLCEGCSGDWNRLWGTPNNRFTQIESRLRIDVIKTRGGNSDLTLSTEIDWANFKITL
jgi:hypothetical protein